MASCRGSRGAKKRLLRTVLYEIMIDSMAEPSEYLLRLHWYGGVHTELRVARHAPASTAMPQITMS